MEARLIQGRGRVTDPFTLVPIRSFEFESKKKP
jgi:hypothetical protein